MIVVVVSSIRYCIVGGCLDNSTNNNEITVLIIMRAPRAAGVWAAIRGDHISVGL